MESVQVGARRPGNPWHDALQHWQLRNINHVPPGTRDCGCRSVRVCSIDPEVVEDARVSAPMVSRLMVCPCPCSDHMRIRVPISQERHVRKNGDRTRVARVVAEEGWPAQDRARRSRSRCSELPSGSTRSQASHRHQTCGFRPGVLRRLQGCTSRRLSAPARVRH